MHFFTYHLIAPWRAVLLELTRQDEQQQQERLQSNVNLSFYSR